MVAKEKVMLDIQTMWSVVLTCIVGAVGWFARELWYSQKDLRKDLADHREKIAQEYVTKVDFKDALTDLRTIMLRVYDKLDGKVDKTN